MKRYYIEKDKFNKDQIVLDGVEHNHLKNVMRTQLGDHVIVVCGDGYDYECEVVKIDKNKTYLSLINQSKNNNEPKRKLTVFQALTKWDNMSLIVQKLTELGVAKLVPFESEFITAKDKDGKTEKLQSITNQSIKQCKRACPIKVEKTLKFKEVLNVLKEYEVVIFANECEENMQLENLNFPYENIAIVVGSEGGFSKQEIAQLTALKNVKSISMGKRILRSETASIVLSGVIMYLQGEWING